MEASSFLLFEEGKHQLVGASFLPDSVENDEIIVTELHGVYIYNVSDQKSSKAWTARSSTKFTCPAVQESVSKEKQFFVVEGNKTLWSWDHHALKIEERAIKKGFKKNIFTVLESKGLKGNVAVVFEDGGISICDKSCASIATNEEGVEQKTKKVEKASVFLVGDTVVVFVIRNQRGTYSVTTYGILHDKEKDKWNIDLKFSHDVPLPENIAKGTKLSLESTTFDANSRILSLIWSDGSWDIFEYHQQYLAKESYQNPTRVLSRKLKAFKMGDGNSKGSPISNSNIVLFGHKADSNDYLLTAWNSIYGTLQGELNIKDIDPTHNVLQVLSSKDGNLLIIVLSGTVIVCPIYCPPASLANALGKMKTTTHLLGRSEYSSLLPVTPNMRPKINELFQSAIASNQEIASKEIDQNVNWNENDNFIKKSDELLQKLINKEVTPTINEFKVVWKQLKEKIGNNKWERELFFTPQISEQLVNRCLADGFWKILQNFIKNGKVSARALPHFIPTLIEKKQDRLLIGVMQNTVDIAPSDVVLLLKYFITDADLEQLKNEFNKHKSRQLRAREQFLNYILEIKYSSAFMHPALKALSLDEVMFLLRYLADLLDDFGNKPAEQIKLENAFTPSFPSVVQWLHLMLDCHFTQLVLMKQSHEMLHSLRKLTGDQIQFCKQLEGVRRILKHARILEQSNQGKLQYDAMGEYSIEILKF